MGRPNQKREHEGAQYAPANLLRAFTRENWTKTPTEVAIEDPNELDQQYEAAIDREASLRTKTGTTGDAGRGNTPDMARILVLLAEQTQRLATEGMTCVKCGKKTTLNLNNPYHYANIQKGLGLSCSQCNTYLVQCNTMESAGIPTERIEYAHKLVEIKHKTTGTLGQHLETNSEGQKRTCTARERQLTQTAYWKLEEEGLRDNEVSISLIGTGDHDAIKKVLKLGESLFCYMQEDLPALQQQTKHAQPQEDTTLALKALNQRIREQDEATKAEGNKINKLHKRINREHHTHEEK